MNGKARDVTTWALLIGLAGLVGARGSEAAAEPTPSSQAKLFTAAPIYAGLFVEGAVWKFRGSLRESYYEPSDRRANRRGNVVDTTKLRFECRVTSVQRGADAVTSEITCDSQEALLGARFGATSRGLFRFERESADAGAVAVATPVSAAVVEKATLVLPPSPKAGRTKRVGEVGQIEIITVTKKGRAWCWDYYFFLGDESGETLCFSNGKPSRLASLSAGGFVREFRASLVQ